jgi:hypothetical protein
MDICRTELPEMDYDYEGDYEIEGVSLASGDVVVDAGASIGLFSAVNPELYNSAGILERLGMNFDVNSSRSLLQTAAFHPDFSWGWPPRTFQTERGVMSRISAGLISIRRDLLRGRFYIQARRLLARSRRQRQPRLITKCRSVMP